MDLNRMATKILLLLFCLSLCFGSTSNATAQTTDFTIKTQGHIPKAPQRIVVLPLFAEEMLLEMIGPKHIVGNGYIFYDYYNYYKTYENAEVVSPTIALTAEIQGGLSIDDAESILKLEPDLVVLWSARFGGYETLLPALEQAGVAVLFLDTPENFDDVKDCLTTLGSVVGAPEKAAQMVQAIEAGLAELKLIVAGIPENKRIRATYYCDYSPSPTFDEIADAANVISDRGTVFVQNHYDYLEIDTHLLSEWNPELITVDPFYCDTDGSLLGIDNGAGIIAYLQENTGFSTISAIKNQNIHPLSIHNSQYMLQSAVDLAKLAYPDRFIEQSD